MYGFLFVISKVTSHHELLSQHINTQYDNVKRGNSGPLKTIRKPFTRFITVCYIWHFQQVEVTNL